MGHERVPGQLGVVHVVHPSVASGKSSSDCRDVPIGTLFDERLHEGRVLELTGIILNRGDTGLYWRTALLPTRGRQLTLLSLSLLLKGFPVDFSLLLCCDLAWPFFISVCTTCSLSDSGVVCLVSPFWSQNGRWGSTRCVFVYPSCPCARWWFRLLCCQFFPRYFKGLWDCLGGVATSLGVVCTVGGRFSLDIGHEKEFGCGPPLIGGIHFLFHLWGWLSYSRQARALQAPIQYKFLFFLLKIINITDIFYSSS